MLVRHSALQVVSAQPLIAQLLEHALDDRLPDYPQVKLLLDTPPGHAFHVLCPETALHTFVLTENPCPEYLDDLWNLGPLGLALRVRSLEELAELLRRAETAQRVRLTPTATSILTVSEARILRLVALGQANKEVARTLNIANQTVQNALTRVFEKLGVANRAEAMLYYWGIIRDEGVPRD